MRILFLTSMPLSYSGGLALEQIKALSSAGHSIEVLTKYDWPRYGQRVIAVNHVSCVKRFRHTIHKIISDNKVIVRLVRYLRKQKKYVNVLPGKGIKIANPDESNPPINVDSITDRLEPGKYDLIITLFLEGMFTIYSIQAIYNKLRCPVIIQAVDQAPFTGGCWFSLNCNRYEDECGFCPAIDSKDRNDITHRNYLIKKEAYSHMDYLLFTNTWMSRYAKASRMLDDNRLATSCILINEEKFKPLDKKKCRKKFGLDQNGIIFLTRYHLAKSKGIEVYLNALDSVYDDVKEEDKLRVTIVFVGAKDTGVGGKIRFKTVFLPGLGIDRLIELYNASSFFVSPSISDAGPSMVNQSIMCGTPVCCFNIGTAIDVIKDGVNGYKTNEMTSAGLAACLKRAIETRGYEYGQMSKSSRKIAMEYETKAKYVERIESAYGRLSSGILKGQE